MQFYSMTAIQRCAYHTIWMPGDGDRGHEKSVLRRKYAKSTLTAALPPPHTANIAWCIQCRQLMRLSCSLDGGDVTKPLPSWPLCNLIEHLTAHFSLVHLCIYSNAHSIAISYHTNNTSSQSYYEHVYGLLHSSSLIAQRSQLLHWSGLTDNVEPSDTR